ncbi:methylated-DNA--[protein]-cysteine S-methyltransferase [Jatrophihabitans telluris]
MMDSPIGVLLLVGEDEPERAVRGRTDSGNDVSVAGLYTAEHVRLPTPPGDRDDAAFARATEELTEYFEGQRRDFDVCLNPRGTEFQRHVWSALRSIPFGHTASYADIAAAVGRPSAVRAVGAANGRNPISIIVPCHRVVGSNGALTGYAGGLEAKNWLLTHERAVAGLASAGSPSNAVSAVSAGSASGVRLSGQ